MILPAPSLSERCLLEPGSPGAPPVGDLTRISRPRDQAVIDWLTRHLLA